MGILNLGFVILRGQCNAIAGQIKQPIKTPIKTPIKKQKMGHLLFKPSNCPIFSKL